MTRTGVTVPLLLVLFLSACGNDSQQAHETLVSWNKSLELVEQQRSKPRLSRASANGAAAHSRQVYAKLLLYRK